MCVRTREWGEWEERGVTSVAALEWVGQREVSQKQLNY